MTDTVQERTTGAENVVWDLSHFYQGADDPAIDRDMDDLRGHVNAWAQRYRGRVASLSAAEMAEAMASYEALLDRIGRLGSFAGLLYTTDTNNATYGALQQKLDEYEAELQQKLLFFELEWLALEDDAAQKVLNDPAIGKYRHYLEAERRFKPHKLSEIEEQLLVEKDVTGRGAWVRLFTQIGGASRYDLDGQTLTQPQALAKLVEPDRDLRKRAADAITKVQREKAMELTFIFNVLAADKASDDRRRRYPSWVSSRNLMNKANDAIVEALITAVTSNYDIVARHYEVSRRILGYDELYDYDRLAPLPIPESERKVNWDEARQIVQDAYGSFSPRLGEIVQRFFDENWIHAALMPGKRGGAFSAGTVPSAHPYILMNFTGRADDVRTLAHELGHGVHQYLAAEKQGLFGASTPLTTAEMASVFGEMIVLDNLMRAETDPAVKLSMRAQSVQDSIGTVFRQIAMNRFEDRAHNARRQQGELTTEQISDMWMATQRDMFQGSVTLRDEYSIWWSYIPHFLQTPGYVYAYAFGKLLVLALYNVYKERGTAFVPQYLDVLAAGGSDYPEGILAPVGVDLTNPDFWSEGLDAIRAMVEEEEQLARQVFPERMG